MLSINGANGEGPLASVSMPAALLTMKLLCGRLYEAWQFVTNKDNGAAFKAIEPHLDSQATEARRSLGRYFGADNIITKVRNKAAFHWDREHVAAAIATLSDDEYITEFLAPVRGQVYYGSGAILDFAQLHSIIGASSAEKSLDIFRNEVLDTATNFQTFAEGVNSSFLERHVGLSREKFDEVRVDIDAPKVETANIAYFVDLTDLQGRLAREESRGRLKARLLNSAS